MYQDGVIGKLFKIQQFISINMTWLIYVWKFANFLLIRFQAKG
jgi:hypothetical protein